MIWDPTPWTTVCGSGFEPLPAFPTVKRVFVLGSGSPPGRCCRIGIGLGEGGVAVLVHLGHDPVGGVAESMLV